MALVPPLFRCVLPAYLQELCSDAHFLSSVLLEYWHLCIIHIVQPCVSELGVACRGQASALHTFQFTALLEREKECEKAEREESCTFLACLKSLETFRTLLGSSGIWSWQITRWRERSEEASSPAVLSGCCLSISSDWLSSSLSAIWTHRSRCCRIC